MLALEYPGYGVFTHEIRNNRPTTKMLSCQTKWIKENAIKVFQHVIKPKELGGLGYKSEDVIILGSSIGTGPATFLASMFQAYALILISPFTSIKNVANDMSGVFGPFIDAHFNNEEAIKGVKCPTCFIHGDRDHLIPWYHS